MSETAKMLHVNLAPGEAGRYAIVPGDPDRCELIAAHLDNPRMVTRKREFTTWEGTLDGERVTVTSTGIGGPSTAICVEELHKCGADTFIRVGTCASTCADVQCGDIVVVSGSVRMDGTSLHYLPMEFPAVPSYQLLKALEASTYCTPTAIGGFPQVSGITFTVDTTKAYDRGDLYPGSTYYGPKSIQRVSIQTVGGKAFDKNATYTIATNDFMAAGGDTYYAFAAASVNYDLGLPMDEVVMDYITDELDGVVTAEDYGAPNGRITIEKGLPFTDVAADAAYYDEVKYCYDNNIFKGVTATTFAPLSTLTRGQMVTVLWRMNGSPAPAGTCPFTDVAADSPFRQAITWAAEKGLTNGTTATTFAPGQAISRQQFLTILYRYAQFMKYDVSKTATIIGVYADWGAVSEYAQEAMEWAAGSGVLIADKALRPTDAALRYEVAEFLANFCQKVAAETTVQQAA